MKFNKWTLILAAFAALAVSLTPSTAPAQGSASDLFGAPRTIQVVPTASINNFTNIGTATLAGLFTNIIDTHGYLGIAKLDIITASNKADAAIQARLTNYLYQSDDLATWTLVSSVAIATSTSVIYTNLLIGTNTTATDNYLLPGTYTTPTTASSGWGTGYIVPAPFTNNAIFNQSSGGVTSVGYVIEDAKRYLALVTSTTGTNSTYSVEAILTGRRGGEVK